MTFYEELVSNGIAPALLVELQLEFIFTTKAKIRDHSIDYRDYLELDQSLTMLEKFVHRVEREILHQKIKIYGSECSNANSFYENLLQQNIRPEKFIVIQNEFIRHFNSDSVKSSESNYRLFLERDQLLTAFEKLMSQVERERLLHKIIQITTPSYPG
jgi:hypothetical protein